MKNTDDWDVTIYKLLARCEYMSVEKRYKLSNETTTRLIIHHKAKSSVKKFIRGKGLYSFIKNSILQKDGRYFIDGNVFLLFEEIDEFPQFIGQLREDPVLIEYKTFINLLKSTNFKSTVNLKFREIQL